LVVLADQNYIGDLRWKIEGGRDTLSARGNKVRDLISGREKGKKGSKGEVAGSRSEKIEKMDLAAKCAIIQSKKNGGVRERQPAVESELSLNGSEG